MTPAKVLHVIARLPVGGVEQQLLHVVTGYDRKRFVPIVCSLSEKDEIGREIEKRGIKIYALEKLKHRFSWTIVNDLVRIIEQERVSIVRTHQYHANLYGRLAAVRAKVPCIIPSVHNIYLRDRKPHRRIINHILARWSDMIVAVSNAVRGDILRYDGVGMDKVTVIYNGVDLNGFRDADKHRVRMELGIKDHAIVIGSVGRITVQKGQSFLIEAFAQVSEKIPDAVLLLVGDGPLRAQLMQRADALGVSRSVIFTGMRRDVPALVGAVDLFVFPSLWEGLGTALIEAMAAGKAVIASDLPPLREIIGDSGAGIMIPPGDVPAMVIAIEKVLGDSALCSEMGKAARCHARNNFSLASTIDGYMNLYASVISGKEREIT